MVRRFRLLTSVLCLTVAASTSVQAQSNADLELRLAAIEEALRDLRGSVEENDYRVRKLSKDMERFQKDTEFRFNEIDGIGDSSAASLNAPAEATAPAVNATADTMRDMPRTPINQPMTQTSAGDGMLRGPTYQHPDYSSPRDLYNYAFRLLNQTKYDQSADAFANFITQYPNDPLIGNAYYWQGETYYIRRDYVKAADSFRQGFEVLPNGPKAPDNLLKLSMSLSAIDRNQEACIVLGQILSKYSKQSVSVTQKARQEQQRIGC